MHIKFIYVVFKSICSFISGIFWVALDGASNKFSNISNNNLDSLCMIVTLGVKTVQGRNDTYVCGLDVWQNIPVITRSFSSVCFVLNQAEMNVTQG